MSDTDFGTAGSGLPADEAVHAPIPPEAFFTPQQIYPILHRSACNPQQVVYLKDYCFTTNQIFPPGEYQVSQLPDIAFNMGLVIPPPKPIVKTDKHETIEKVIDNDP
jgi:hypothetical protein